VGSKTKIVRARRPAAVENISCPAKKMSRARMTAKISTVMCMRKSRVSAE
jgi:hypothetical protein